MKNNQQEPARLEPVYSVQPIKFEDIQPNDYNPNFVAHKELDLLYVSIKEDGFTQPVVCYWNEEKGKYVIIDGFHRYSIMKTHKDIYERAGGYLPCVVLNKTKEERMLATIRHNRARGRHEIVGMANIVNDLIGKMSDEEISKRMGMEKQEIERLKIGSGWLAMFEKVDYSKAWKKKLQIQVEKSYARQ